MLVRLNSWPFTGPLTLVSLSDYENAFLNVEPERIIGALRQYPAGTIEPDALAFGLVVFEMTFGFELDSSLQLSRIREHDLIPAKAPPVIKSVCLSLVPFQPLSGYSPARSCSRASSLVRPKAASVRSCSTRSSRTPPCAMSTASRLASPTRSSRLSSPRRGTCSVRCTRRSASRTSPPTTRPSQRRRPH